MRARERVPCLADDGCGSPRPSPAPCREVLFRRAPPWHAGDPPRPAVVFLHGAGGSGAVGSRTTNLRPTDHGTGLRPAGATGRSPPGAGRCVLVTRLTAAGAGRGHLPRARCSPTRTPRFHLDRNAWFVTGFSMGRPGRWQPPAGHPASLCRLRSGRRRLLAWPAHRLCRPGQAAPYPRLARRRGPDGRLGASDQRPGRHLRGAAGVASASMAAARPMPTASRIAQFWQRTWTGCAPGSALTFGLHPGGHEVPEAGRIWRWIGSRAWCRLRASQICGCRTSRIRNTIRRGCERRPRGQPNRLTRTKLSASSAASSSPAATSSRPDRQNRKAVAAVDPQLRRAGDGEPIGGALETRRGGS